MKKTITLTILLGCFQMAQAQLDVPPVANNPRATISEEVGITSITISYSRPDVNKREGKIWGTVIPIGFTNPSFITNKPTSPWRAGANENTTIAFEHEVKVEGKDIKAGKYGLSIAYGVDSSTVIFNRVNNAWGSFNYEAKDDVLRVKVKNDKSDKSVEWLKYEFINYATNSCTIALIWENVVIPFKVSVNVEDIVIASLRDQMKSNLGFNATIATSAVNYCVTANKNLDEAYEWSKRANLGNNGQKSFQTISSFVTVALKTNHLKEADSLMNDLPTFGNAQQLTAFGRNLITAKQADRAMKLFQENQKRNGDNFNTNSGLMRGYSAKGDFTKALEYADKALAQAPEPQKKGIEDLKAKLKENKDIN